MNLEEQLKQELSKLYDEYKAKAKPIIDKLVELEAMKPPKPIVIEIDRFTGLPKFPPDNKQ